MLDPKALEAARKAAGTIEGAALWGRVERAITAYLAASQEPAPVAWADWRAVEALQKRTASGSIYMARERSDAYNCPLYAAPVPPVVGEDAVEDMRELLRMIDTVQSTPSHESVYGIYNPASPMGRQVEKVRAALASSVAKPCGVDELEWEETWSGYNDDIPTWRGNNPLAIHVGVSFAGKYKLERHDAAPAAELAERKAAAQADYERRILSCLSHPAQGWREPEGAYIRTGVHDRDGREILVGDTIRIDLASPHTKEEYWRPEYRVAFKAPSFVLEHIGGDKDSETAQWYFRVPQKRSTEKIETLTVAPSAPAGGSGDE